MKPAHFLLLISTLLFSSNMSAQQPAADPVKLSVQLLQQVKAGKPAESIQRQLRNLPKEQLSQALQTDTRKKAFWINIYNAYIQLILQENPGLYEDRSDFFGEERFTIAGESLSFDEIEHGLLRHSAIKLSLGYLQDPFAGEFEKQFRVAEVDPRIHFALNCGAASCPPVAIYNADNFDSKADAVARQFLQKQSRYDKADNTVYTTTLFRWFKGDFGSDEDIIALLQKYGAIPPSAQPELEHTDYDWNLKLDHYYE
jgi:hypothetical protein